MCDVGKMVNVLPEMSVEEKILLALAKNKEPQTHYLLWKKHEVASSNKTVLATLNRLKDSTPSMIEFHQEKKGRRRKFYKLTFDGLIGCLRHEESWRSIDQIAEAQKTMLPLIFGKWNFFKKENILDEIIRRFKKVVRFLWEGMTTIVVIPTGIREAQKLWNGKLNQLVRAEDKTFRRKRAVQVAGFVFGIHRLRLLTLNIPSQIHGDPRVQKMLKEIEPLVEEQKSLLLVLQREAELKKYIEWLLQNMESDFRLELENVESWRKWFQDTCA